MAKLPYGILGPPKGKLGGKIYTSWKGVAIVKDAPKKSIKEPSPLQLEQQEKFGLLNAFFSVICEITKIGFMGYTKDMTASNAALKFNPGILTGTFPNYKIDYSKVLISMGSLPEPFDTQLRLHAKGEILVSWDFHSSDQDGSDTPFALFYNETVNECHISAGIVRKADGLLHFRKQAEEENDVFHVWLFFRKSNKKAVSNSAYLGNI